jgi:hypothetical protein
MKYIARKKLPEIYLGGPSWAKTKGGVETDCLVEQRSETDGKHAGSAVAAQEPTAPVETDLLGEDNFELRRVRGTTIAVVSSRTAVDGGVIGHPTSRPESRYTLRGWSEDHRTLPSAPDW